jgi:hypothetical protein
MSFDGKSHAELERVLNDAFDARNAPPYVGFWEVASDALVVGGLGGMVLGVVLAGVHHLNSPATPSPS